MLAYLVIREGSKWTDVFRLVPGQSVTVGRSPTNQVVLKDPRCSRCHAELFLSEDSWTLRDLDSRNGTLVGENSIRGDYVLSPGDVIRIGKSHMAFVHDLSKAFADSSSGGRGGNGLETATRDDWASGDSSVLTEHEPTRITHRRGQTRFLEPAEEEDSEVSRAGRAAAKLCRLAFELAKAPYSEEVAERALAGVFEGTHADSGAVLLVLPQEGDENSEEELEVVASRADAEVPYHRVSSFLAATVVREGEAVLARNVVDDSKLSPRDSHGDMYATSVICAPIRQGDHVSGLLHLYSTNPEKALDPDDLEFTLAVADSLAVALQNLERRQELAENLTIVRDENLQLRQQLGVESEIVGGSPAVQTINEEIARAAPSRATVLIRGESGVGKELVARAVHYSSPRKKGPFVCLNCAALSESLLESELFGHERGAFTGATERKVGKFEAADRGTLMLDEIGEMDPSVQVKFLRVLEGHPFERVGGSTPVQVDVRVIAATNRDLEKDVAEGLFRRDLYFRLKVLEIVVPALRKRPTDIPELANHFLARFKAETGSKIRGLTATASEKLQAYRWPGNIRELKNVIERAVLICPTELIDADDLMLSQLPTDGDSTMMPIQDESEFTPVSLSEIERRHIRATLQATGWNKSRTASILGIERSTLDRKIRRYNLGERALGRRR